MAPLPKKPTWIIGIDEVGRGPLAGPVYVCAVAIPLTIYKKMRWKGLNDSKQMTALARERWYDEARRMEEDGKIKLSLSFRSAKVIDEQGISVCISSCVKKAINKLDLSPEDCLVLLDGGLRAPERYINQQTIIQGDKRQKAISLASVVAKVTRDRYMTQLHRTYPEYRWFENKGYGTKKHIEVVQGKGLSPLHRKTFCSKLFF